MILGLGSDLVDIRRIEAALARHGERFVARLFTPVERAKCEARAGRAAGYARRFAAKEACAKALGTGLKRGVFWRDMGVVNLPGGRPTLVLTGGARRQLDMLVPKGLAPQIDLTLTDDEPYAQAIVIISAVPRNPPDSGTLTGPAP
jgi:holo-[acyl-carrier protein] synthase